MADRKWTVRKRFWPNGQLYFVVMKGSGRDEQVLISEKGEESRFPSRDIAQHWANEHNDMEADNG